MTSEDRGDSLADAAAAWVPPWARRPGDAAEPAEVHAGPDAVPAAVPAVEAGAEPVAGPGAEPVAGPGAEPAAEAGVERERVAESTDRGYLDPPEPDHPSTIGEGQAALALIDDGELRAALEAILLVVDEPVGEVALAQVLEQPTDRIGVALGELAGAYAKEGRGFDLRRAAGGWRLYTRPEYARYVERFVLDGQQLRLTQAALETLAVVAYKQPVTRSRISAIRGVNCDGVIRTLVSRGLVEECGAEPDSGAFLYRTTSLFLEKLGLDSVDQLPPLAPFLPDDVDEVADAER